jgi:pSer/pThr/pTyr-binding forkhead associated (FHA) protein
LGRGGDTLEFFRDIPTVSRRHALVSFRDGVWTLTDLASTNGTWINGARIDSGTERPVGPGDVIALSLACEMRVI